MLCKAVKLIKSGTLGLNPSTSVLYMRKYNIDTVIAALLVIHTVCRKYRGVVH